MKKWIPIILMMLMIPIAVALEECSRTITTNDVPCIIKSSWTYSSCAGTVMKVYNSTPTILDTRTFTDFGSSGRCNTTWNYSEVGSYFWNVSNGDSGTIIVEVDSEMNIAIAIVFTAFAILFILIGLYLFFTRNDREATKNA